MVEFGTADIQPVRPDVLKEIKAGKYTSVRAAAKAAGILKEASPSAAAIAVTLVLGFMAGPDPD